MSLNLVHHPCTTPVSCLWPLTFGHISSFKTIELAFHMKARLSSVFKGDTCWYKYFLLFIFF